MRKNQTQVRASRSARADEPAPEEEESGDFDYGSEGDENDTRQIRPKK